jgi:hypothetical protein
MNRAPDQFAHRLSRQQRRRLDRALRKPFRQNKCSFCGGSFPHCSATAGGFDAHDNVVLAGECCVSKVAKIFAMGLTMTVDPIAAVQQKATVDKIFDNAERCGGLGRPSELNLADSPWKDADRKWFEQNSARSHRVRMPFSGEVDEAVASTPVGTVLMIIVRQVKPGYRYRAAVSVDTEFLPLPDDEATVHALLEVVTGREAMPPDRSALHALSKKYSVQGGQRGD